MVVSLIIHAVLVVVAVSYVAVTVIQKDDQHFEDKKVRRQKVPLKKLQVPVEVTRKRQVKPKLRKRIVVKPRLNQQVPDIRMPEITGVKSGMGSAGDGIGGGGSLGFAMPEINIFGLKSRGEKIFLILDCGPTMMADARGGIPAFNIIKNELLTIVGNLPSTTLFNISVYSKNSTYLLFPKMMSASPDNVAKAERWLSPLNQFRPGMGNREYGPGTLGPGGGGGTKTNVAEPPLRSSGYWLRPALMAMQQQADAVYVLTEDWGSLNHVVEVFEGKTWSEDKRKKFNEAVAKAKRMFAEENRQRREKGLPPKVLPNTRAIVNAYVPGTKFPPGNKKKHHYGPGEIQEGMVAVRKKHAGKGAVAVRSGVVKRKDEFSFNVIHFTTKANNEPIAKFKTLTNNLDGDYKRLKGLDAIRFNANHSPEIAGEEPAFSPTMPAAPQGVEASSTESVPLDPIIGKWGYAKRKVSYEFTAEGTCIQLNRKGLQNWSAPYSMSSSTVANVERDGGKRFELQGDGSLKTHDGQIIRRL